MAQTTVNCQLYQQKSTYAKISGLKHLPVSDTSMTKGKDRTTSSSITRSFTGRSVSAQWAGGAEPGALTGQGQTVPSQSRPDSGRAAVLGHLPLRWPGEPRWLLRTETQLLALSFVSGFFPW